VMTLSRWKRLFNRPHLQLIALVGVIVPRRFARRLAAGVGSGVRSSGSVAGGMDRLDWRNKLDLLRRSTSAFWDAIWLQTHRWEDAMIQDLRFRRTNAAQAKRVHAGGGAFVVAGHRCDNDGL